VTVARCNGRGVAGFTLLELLAALVVFGLILVALVSGLRFGERAVRAEARDTVAQDQVGPVDSTLRSLIARAWPGATGSAARFSGTARMLSFRTDLPEGLAVARTRDAYVTIGVDAAHHLYLAWLPAYQNWIVPKPMPYHVDLLTGVDHVEFAYWDPSLKLPPGGWVSAWGGASAPRLLRIRLVFAKGAGLRWPDIVVATARDPFVF
jgi:general secretion pathway protein J